MSLINWLNAADRIRGAGSQAEIVIEIEGHGEESRQLPRALPIALTPLHAISKLIIAHK